MILWIMYCLIHSLFAENKVKNYIQTFMKKRFKYYRPLYSIFAFITLALILWFHFSIKSPRLFGKTIFAYLPGIIAGFTGLSIMLICINKYFYEMSGLQAIQSSQAKNTLQQTGIHKCVRHPLYLGTLLFIWGLFLVFPLMNNIIAAATITTYVLIGIKLEEKKLKLQFGESYIEYAKKIPKLIPGIKTQKRL
ncbi:MAG: isoprenylcysteine carboxylmethyltransferase family protein [Ginsengibacter sp.]